MAWYNQSWLYRVEITVDATKVDADLTDFVNFLSGDDLPADVFDNAKTNGEDVRITTSNGTTEVPFEIVNWDNTTDTAEIHFKAYVDSTTDTVFYLYYGNSGASAYGVGDTYGRNAVWADYAYVNHHNSTTGQDSSGNYGASSTVGSPVTATSTVMDKSLEVDLNEGITHSYNSKLEGATAISISEWSYVNHSGSNNVPYKFAIVDSSNSNRQIILNNAKTVNYVSLYIASSSSNSDWGQINITVTGGLPDLTWFHSCITANLSTSSYNGYINGSSDTTGTSTSGLGFPSSIITPSGSPFVTIGRAGNGGTFSQWDGNISETRVRIGELSSSWISTEYNNQNSPSTFYSVSTQQVLSTFKPQLLLLI